MNIKSQSTSVHPIRLGLIGCGGIVKLQHLPAFLSIPERINIVALADLIPANMEEIARLLGQPSLPQYTDYRDMFVESRLDAVSIATPHHIHTQNVLDAAAAGVAIICEKPMTTSLEEADVMLAAVNRHDVSFSIVHNFLFTPAVQQAISLREGGHLGRVTWGQAKSLFNKANELPAAAWRHHQAMGGGALNDTAYHEIYLVEALVGSPVRYVEGRLRTTYYPFDIDDLVLLTFEHENGVLSTVATSWCTPGRGDNNFVEVHGTHDSVRVTGRGRSLHRYHRAERAWADVELPAFDDMSQETQRWVGHANYFAAVSDALRNGTSLPVTGAQARHNLAIIAAARRASQERRAIALDDV